MKKKITNKEFNIVKIARNLSYKNNKQIKKPAILAERSKCKSESEKFINVKSMHKL